jgi:hypothetical protein
MAKSLGDSIKKAVLGDAANEVIKAGTTVATRGIGVIAIALLGTFYLLDQFGDAGPWEKMTASAKLWFVLGAGAIWAVVAAADTLARGISAAKQPPFLEFPAGLDAALLKGQNEPGWRVVGAKLSGTGDTFGYEFLAIKGDEVRWLKAEQLDFDHVDGGERGQLSRRTRGRR